ncbi:MAG TPA: ABC transporter ATP-binding protein [candidate division Zixibacteria bacterium]|jgi:sodium transport system ATP-binding protein|nr:ABC transporter ATP-binding protein [candidate division Zixibacteria bacterium]
MIKTLGLGRSFWDPGLGEIQALLPLDLSIDKGEIFGILGPNGAGKTTLLRLLATVIKPTAGTALVNGFDVVRDQMPVKKSIGFLSGNTRLYGRLTPRELLRYFGQLYDMDGSAISARSRQIVQLLDMGDFFDQRIEKLSTGQTQKTSIARCLLHDPPVLILDEPTLGLDIMTSRTIIDFIRSSAMAGKTVIFSTHYMEEAELLCSRIGLLHRGRLMDADGLDGFRRKTGLSHLADIFMEYVGRQAEPARRNGKEGGTVS